MSNCGRGGAAASRQLKAFFCAHAEEPCFRVHGKPRKGCPAQCTVMCNLSVGNYNLFASVSQVSDILS